MWRAVTPAGRRYFGMLEWVPGSFKVIRHVRPKLSCAGCERIVQAPAPSRPIERGLAGPGLLAHVLVAKYCDHLPLVSPGGDVCPRRCRAGAFDAGRLGGRHQPTAGTSGGSVAPPCCERATSCMPMTRRFRCWRQAMAKPRLVGSGPMCGMIARRVTTRRQQFGLPTRRIVAASIRESTCAASAARCRPMPTLDSIIFMRVDGYRKRPAGRMYVASSTTCR